MVGPYHQNSYGPYDMVHIIVVLTERNIAIKNTSLETVYQSGI